MSKTNGIYAKCARILPQDVLYVIGIKNVVVVRHMNEYTQPE